MSKYEICVVDALGRYHYIEVEAHTSAGARRQLEQDSGFQIVSVNKIS